jgi:phosphomethylpyrimidine synthase
MKISQDVRHYAAEHGIAENEAVTMGMREKAEEFNAAGGRVYLPIHPA